MNATTFCYQSVQRRIRRAHHGHDANKRARRARRIGAVYHIDGCVRKQIIVVEVGIELENFGIVPVRDATGENIDNCGTGGRWTNRQSKRIGRCEGVYE